MNNFILNNNQVTDNNKFGYDNQTVGIICTPENVLPYFIFPLSMGSGAVTAFYIDTLDFWGDVVSTESLDIGRITKTATYYELTNQSYSMNAKCLYRLRIETGAVKLVSQNFITFVKTNPMYLTADTIEFKADTTEYTADNYKI